MISEISGAIMLILLGALAIFQLLLAIGKPYGQYAWGGAHTILPAHLRIGSLLSVALYIVFGFIVAGAVGWNDAIANQSYMVILAIYSTIGVFLNSISRSKNERAVMVPVTVTLAICSWIIVLA